MKVTFIFHSSFAVELDRTVLIFDYYGEGQLPDMPEEKKIYFFNSHNHRDHYDKKILNYRTVFQNSEPEYILSRDIRLRPEEKKPWIHSVKAAEEYTIGPLKIRTLKSTDAGVAFLIETEGLRIYHAGDLNWWHWEEESKAWNNNMAANYKRQIETIDGCHIDLAFLVLDPRLEQAYNRGINYFLEHVFAIHVFPMHCWEQYDICKTYLNHIQSVGNPSLL